jgi:AraC-like DNA-binding protein
MNEQFFYTLAGPLDASPADRQMRSANFSGFPTFVRTLGGDPRGILERHGVDPLAIRDPDSYMNCQSLVDVLEDCSTKFNDPLFGLKLAHLQEPEYVPVVHAPVAQMELVEGKDIAEFRWYVPTDLGTNHQANYQAVMLDLKVLQLLGGRYFRASYINLTVDARQRDIAEIESKLGCRFNNRATTNAIAFPSALLDQPVQGASKLVFKLLSGYLDRVKMLSRKTIVERVEDFVRGSLQSGHCSIEHCAAKLGTSVRTLQSQLSEYGFGFAELLEKQRVEQAKKYLEQRHLSLDEVAALLGYSEQSSFGRAFKRWTGLTPQRFRAMQARAGSNG